MRRGRRGTPAERRAKRKLKAKRRQASDEMAIVGVEQWLIDTFKRVFIEMCPEEKREAAKAELTDEVLKQLITEMVTRLRMGWAGGLHDLPGMGMFLVKLEEEGIPFFELFGKDHEFLEVNSQS
jgi:hypothetical protein